LYGFEILQGRPLPLLCAVVFSPLFYVIRFKDFYRQGVLGASLWSTLVGLIDLCQPSTPRGFKMYIFLWRLVLRNQPQSWFGQ
jgi:hypothetical protein